MRDNPADRLLAVCTLDPAIDRGESDVDTYAEDRDLHHIRPLPGRSLQVFALRPIGAHLFTEYVDAVASVPAKWRRAFQAGVELITGYPDKNGDPTTFKPRTPLRLAKRETMIIGDDEILSVADRLGLATIYEIGHLVYERTVLGKALTDGGVSWSLPPSSVVALERIARRRAALSQKSSETNSTASSSSASLTSSDSSSADPSDATAAATAGTESPSG